MKTKNAIYIRTLAAIFIGFGLASCANNSATVPVTEYSTKIVGRWQGTVGKLKENMSINADGTFICHLNPMGFLANTLSQGVPGTISGTWNITGSRITLKIISSENEDLMNKVASSTIERFRENTLTLKSDLGETSSFQRLSSQ